MKVVFLQDVPAQKAHRDDVREVAEGFARNFLFPKGLALPATPHVLLGVQRRARLTQRLEQGKQSAQSAMVKKLEALTLAFSAKAHDGKLYGGIGKSPLIEALAKRGVRVKEKHILLEHPIKIVGEHRVKVHLGEGVEGQFTVRVSEENSRGISK